MKQTKTQSLIEQFVQAGLKFITAMIVWQMIVAPLFGYEITLVQNFWLTFIMMCNSIFFGFFIRRGFDWYHHKPKTILENKI